MFRQIDGAPLIINAENHFLKYDFLEMRVYRRMDRLFRQENTEGDLPEKIQSLGS